MKYSFIAAYLLIPFCLKAQLLLVPEATQTVIIDGVIETGEWEDAISNSAIDNVVNGTIDGSEDLVGSVSFKWDATNLYFLFQITDDARAQDSTDGNPLVINTFDDDSIEVYLDINNTKTGNLNRQAGRYQYRFIPVQDGEIERFPDNLPIDGFQFATVGETSYILEIAMPWATLNVQDPKAGDTLGFEIALNDDDDGDERDGQLFWNADEPDDWMDASKWGNILLTKSLKELNPDPVITDVPNLDIFDVSGQTWISWPENDKFNYQLRKSDDLKVWVNDNRELLMTGNTHYFILKPSDLAEDIFFQVLVSLEDV
jgi:hypothetical protein